MADKIRKYLEDRNEWSVADHISYASSGELPLNPAWTDARREALEDAGIEIDSTDGGDEKAPEDMNIEEMVARIQRLNEPGEYR